MKIYIIGVGCGNAALLTEQARQAVEKCGVVIGSVRIIKEYERKKRTFAEYRADEIKRIIDENGSDTAVIMSGDAGFYSGAKGLIETLDGYDVTVIPGISSMTYFAAKLKMPWDDWKLISAHGLSKNIIGHIRDNEKTFALLNNGGDVNALCEKLIRYGMEDVLLYVGERLSYEDERITSGTAKELVDMTFNKLCVVLAVNGDPWEKKYEISDSEFIRGRVPMTKAEVRLISLAKLRLNKNSVLYDIGAGTGSVGIAAALLEPDMEVFAFERNAEAVELIEKNSIKFRTDNVRIIDGDAQSTLSNHRLPTHAFIGGSGGKMGEIIDRLFELNENIRIVINTVTIETLAETERVLRARDIEAEFTAVNISKGERLGGYTLMKAANPVYIIAFGGQKCGC